MYYAPNTIFCKLNKFGKTSAVEWEGRNLIWMSISFGGVYSALKSSLVENLIKVLLLLVLLTGVLSTLQCSRKPAVLSHQFSSTTSRDEKFVFVDSF